MNVSASNRGVHLLVRRVQRHFKSRARETRSLRAVLHDQYLAAERLVPVVRIAYVFPAFWMATRMFAWEPIVGVKHPVWLWPVAWLGCFDGELAPRVLMGTCVVSSWLASACCTQRWARIVAPIALAEFLGLCFSMGKIHHLMHGWLFALTCLATLPAGWHTPPQQSRGERTRSLMIFGLAQILFALTYTMSGVGKLLGFLYQLIRLEVTSLHPEALSRHVAARLLETGEASLLGEWVISHGVWLWPLVLGTLYLQVFALHFAARPRLHRLLAVGLSGFHLSSALTMFIDFTPAIVLATVLFGASVTAPPHTSLREVVSDLPLIGRFLRGRVLLGRHW